MSWNPEQDLPCQRSCFIGSNRDSFRISPSVFFAPFLGGGMQFCIRMVHRRHDTQALHLPPKSISSHLSSVLRINTTRARKVHATETADGSGVPWDYPAHDMDLQPRHPDRMVQVCYICNHFLEAPDGTSTSCARLSIHDGPLA